MDARLVGLSGLVCGLVLLTGCELLQPTSGSPTSRQTDPKQEDPPPQIVQRPARAAESVPQQSADTSPQVDSRVSEYLDRVQSDATSAATDQPQGGRPDRFEPTIPVERVDRFDRQGPPTQTSRQVANNDLPKPRLVLLDQDVPDAIDVSDISVSTRNTSQARRAPVAAPQLNGVIVNGASLNSRGSSKSAPSNSAAQSAFADVIKALQASGSDDSFRGQLDDRIMHVIAGEYAQARKPLRLVTDEQQALARSLIETLIVSRDEFHLGNQDSAATKMNLELDNLVRSLGKVSDLRIPRLELCPINGVRGYGNFDRLEPAEFVTGLPIGLATYCEIQNLRTQQDSNGWYRSQFDMRTTVLTAGGEVILELDDKGIEDRVATERRDFFVARPIQLPATLSPGSYVIKTTIKDTLGEKVAQARAEFRVTVR